MTWMQFVSSLVSALAWPLTLLACFLFLRKPLVKLIPALQRLRFRELELGFEQTVRELKEGAPGKRLAAILPPESDDLVNRLAAVAHYSARAAIFEAWLEVESAAIELARSSSNDPHDSRRRFPGGVGGYLIRAGLLPGAYHQLFRKLEFLRNQAVGVPDATFDPETIRDYVALSLSLAQFLRAQARHQRATE